MAGVLELCYNVIAILTCRAGGPSTASYARRITAADRIQQLMADGRHALIPPVPLVPYAVSLSLTVAYRGLRDQHVDPERAQADLTTRCETLEALSRSWWTADAMAKLGRKALRSLQQPGVRKHSTANMTNSLEAEVTPCKFGPFAKRDETPAPGLGQEGRENGLQVLSDAAATHGSTSKIHNDPASMAQQHATLLSDPVQHASAVSDNGLSLYTPAAIDVGIFDQFNDLDNLFDGFFDLSMPTIFQDPLFDGAAFLSNDDGLAGHDSQALAQVPAPAPTPAPVPAPGPDVYVPSTIPASEYPELPLS